MTMRYVPGTRPVAVTPVGFAVLEAGATATVSATIRELVAAGRGIAGVLEALTSAYGASLTELPAFAVALVDGDGLRVAVRGDLPLRVVAGTAELVSGAGVMTWTERSFPGGARVSFGDAVTDAAALPLVDGVVLAGGAEWAAVAAPDPSAGTPDPAPSAASAPAAGPMVISHDDVPASDLADYTLPSVRRTATDRTARPDQSFLPDESTLLPEEERGEAGPAPEFDTGWEATVIRGAEEPPADSGDHDGFTVSIAQARAMRASLSTGTTDSMPPLAPARRPAPGQVRVSNGQVVALDRTVVIGRRPRSTRVSGTDLPHLVAVESPQQDISRSHLELRVEGDSIVATDLRTTNGTTLHRPGADPIRLHPGEGTVVVTGDVLDLGDGITVAVEDQA